MTGGQAILGAEDYPCHSRGEERVMFPALPVILFSSKCKPNDRESQEEFGDPRVSPKTKERTVRYNRKWTQMAIGF